MAFVEVLGRDLRLAIRKLGGSPGFTAVAVISLALGIGANTLMFSFMNAVLFKPLPYPDADRLVEIRMTPGRRPTTRMGLTPPMYFMLRDLSKSFDAVGVYDGGRSVSLAGDKNGEAAERLRGHRISATALAAFGVKPYLGRFHTLDEDMDPTSTTVLLGYSLWQRRFGGRRDVVGQTTANSGSGAPACADGYNERQRNAATSVRTSRRREGRRAGTAGIVGDRGDVYGAYFLVMNSCTTVTMTSRDAWPTTNGLKRQCKVASMALRSNAAPGLLVIEMARTQPVRAMVATIHESNSVPGCRGPSG
jgi:hypothetical protein